jgi:hypothetical protein
MTATWVLNGVYPFRNVHNNSWNELVFASIFNYFGVNLLTQSNQVGLPATVALLVYVRVFYNFIFDFLYFEVNFSVLQYVGMAITITFSLTAAAVKL